MSWITPSIHRGGAETAFAPLLLLSAPLFVVPPADAASGEVADGFVPGRLIAHFEDGIVTPPQAAGRDYDLGEMVIPNESHRDVLEEADVESVELLAPLWRNTASRDYIDLHGEEVDDLVDFTNVYVLHLSATTSSATESALERIRNAEIARYVTLDALLSAQGCFTSTFDPDDPLYDEQWGLHNDGSFPDGQVLILL